MSKLDISLDKAKELLSKRPSPITCINFSGWCCELEGVQHGDTTYAIEVGPDPGGFRISETIWFHPQHATELLLVADCGIEIHKTHPVKYTTLEEAIAIHEAQQKEVQP